MFYVYFYDLTPKSPRNYNKLKRKFYYHLNKLKIDKSYWKNKSVLVIPPEMEGIMDSFFISFKPEIEVYKLQTKFIEEI
ncbi:MAG: hypothetical protein PHU63_00040 [Candidatus ainarchaeum sp.]|nr:hypothetical protein [Candidatus ainarchaeum sp.]